MAATPLQAVQEHVDALNTHQKVRVSETITYPFFQGMPDGKKYWYQDEDAYPASTLGPPLLVDTCSEVARSTDGELIVFDVTVDQANDGGTAVVARRSIASRTGRVAGRWSGGSFSATCENGPPPLVPWSPRACAIHSGRHGAFRLTLDSYVNSQGAVAPMGRAIGPAINPGPSRPVETSA